MSNELTLVPDAPVVETQTEALDVTIFEGEETSLDATARITHVEWDLDISRMMYLIHYLDADGNVVIRREIDYYKFEDVEFARKFNNQF